MWRLFFAVVVLVPVIFVQSDGSEIKFGQQQVHYPSLRDCKCRRLVNKCERCYGRLQRQLDDVHAKLAPLANERNAEGSVFAKLIRERQILEFQIKNPGKPVTSPPPIMHMRPPIFVIKLKPMIVNGRRSLSKCQEAITEGQDHLRKEQERIKVLREDILKARTENDQLRAKINELRRQLAASS